MADSQIDQKANAQSQEQSLDAILDKVQKCPSTYFPQLEQFFLSVLKNHRFAEHHERTVKLLTSSLSGFYTEYKERIYSGVRHINEEASQLINSERSVLYIKQILRLRRYADELTSLIEDPNHPTTEWESIAQPVTNAEKIYSAETETFLKCPNINTVGELINSVHKSAVTNASKQRFVVHLRNSLPAKTLKQLTKLKYIASPFRKQRANVECATVQVRMPENNIHDLNVVLRLDGLVHDKKKCCCACSCPDCWFKVCHVQKSIDEKLVDQ
jgi:hypothetical protein